MVLAGLLLCGAAADKLRSGPAGKLSHVVRVGRNGRQLVHSQAQPQAGGRARKVVRRKGGRTGRQLHLAHHAHHALPLLAPPQPVFAPPPPPVRLFNPFSHVAHVAHAVPVPAPAPLPVVRALQPTLEYATPEVASAYLAPATTTPAPEPSAPVAPAYLAPAQEEEETEASEVVAARNSYIAAEEPVQSFLVEAEPLTTVAPVVVAARDSYIAAQPSNIVAKTAANVRVTARPDPIAIVRSVINPPAASHEFDYNFETANGIKQEAVGTMRRVDDTDVTVMRGSYEFVGADSLVYRVEWYADESGFHATAPHLPVSVVPNHPEVAAAVRAQIAFAAEERAAAADRAVAASSSEGSYLAPAEPLPSYN